ncbi:hypothetical protein F5X99DRAFT_411618 [Biscogniauxia marginata]|nr:hypothetical protein F5X99DRAFT_411618 [Biscogniauxia marginata]
MKSALAFAFLWAAIALGQDVPECTRELAATDDCADVINANACYNQFRFTSPRTLTCIGGTDDADRIRKASHTFKWCQRADMLRNSSRHVNAVAASDSRCATG